MTPEPVVVEKRKWDGALSARWGAVAWREGDAVHWWTAAGTPRSHPRRGEEETLAHDEHAVTTGAGWIATAVLGGDGRVLRYEVDATAGRETLDAGVLGFTDMDLDLIAEDGRVAVKDLAQFAARRDEMGYPEAVMRTAMHGLDAARALEAAGAWPFDGSLARRPAGL
ncbi:MAG: hypothetical protein AB7V62_16230 [Thermoleophilia bacterium]